MVFEAKNYRFFGCYLLVSENPESPKGKAYVGFTVDPDRRLRQHNGDLTRGGAKKTKSDRPWRIVCIVHGFRSHVQGLQFEWAWQHPLICRTVRTEVMTRKIVGCKLTSRGRQATMRLESYIHVLAAMLNSKIWSMQPLTVTFFDGTYISKFTSHLPRYRATAVEVHLDVSLFTQERVFKKSDEQNEPHLDDQQICKICFSLLSSRVVVCNHCHTYYHARCLAPLFAINDVGHDDNDDNIGLIPCFENFCSCPNCNESLRWSDLVRNVKLVNLTFSDSSSSDFDSSDDSQSSDDEETTGLQMLRLCHQLRRGDKFHFISPLENSFVEFLQGKNVSSSTVASFISESQPVVNSVNDFVYLHRLASENMLMMSKQVRDQLVKFGDELNMDNLVEIGPLSLALTCSTDLGDDTMSRKILTKISDLLVNESLVLEPRIIVRIVKAIHVFGSSGDDNLGALPDQFSLRIHEMIKSADLTKLNIADIIDIIKFSNDEVYGSILKRLTSIAPLLTPEESVMILVEIVSRSPNHRSFLSLLTDLKKNILASDDSLSPVLIAKAISAFARIGALTNQFRGIVTKNRLSAISENDLNVLRASVLTSPPPKVEDEEKFDPKFLRVINKKRSVESLIRMYSDVARDGLPESIADKLNDLVAASGDDMEKFSHLTMFVELSMLSSSEPHEKLTEYSAIESNRLVKDPFVKDVMNFLEISELSSMSETCPLPVLKRFDDTGVVLDCDSLFNPFSRVVRSKIAEKLGLKYRVIDPISWLATDNKAEYIENLCSNDSVFACDSLVQTGADVRHDPDQPKSPFFGYIRKIDLK